MSSKHSKPKTTASSSSSSASSSLHRTSSHHRSKKPSSSASASASSSSSSAAPPPPSEPDYYTSPSPADYPEDAHLFPSRAAIDKIRPKTRSAPIDIPKRPPREKPPISLSYSESLAAAKAELDPKNRPPGTCNPHITMPEGSFIPPHILAERARGPPKMARSYPGKERFKDRGNPPSWWY
ncbi:unnamed protein product [Agarophyton chilense]